MQKSRHLGTFRPEDLAFFLLLFKCPYQFCFCDEIFEIRLSFLPGMDGLSKVSCLRIVRSHIDTLSCTLHDRLIHKLSRPTKIKKTHVSQLVTFLQQKTLYNEFVFLLFCFNFGEIRNHFKVRMFNFNIPTSLIQFLFRSV